MRRVREHVHHARTRQSVACLVHQQACVARQRRRIARHIDDALRQQIGRITATLRQLGERLGHGQRPFAGRIDQPTIKLAQRGNVISRHLKQIAASE